ncbi:ISNCY family transposase [Verrucomicrobium sp. 3C]|uniref:ISNCY family transposase n=1 Tax=Verrucomicrobium sp. 3C TaxID=1134055 RepID=UPI001E4B8DE7|nr:ISNCY family transposase [Verrucomicrobium sp. 3C]
MKVQEVIMRAMAKRISWLDAAEILEWSPRTLWRWRARYRIWGYDGLFDRRKRRPSPRRVPMETVEKVLGLYRERYEGWNGRHFHEKLREEHGIELSYSWVKCALQAAGLLPKRKRGRVHRLERERRPMRGMLLHVDGSTHDWIPGLGWQPDLIAFVDDATSEVYEAFLCEEEGTKAILSGLRSVIEKEGLFCSLYTDRGSHFFHTPEAGKGVDREQLTQVGRALAQLGIEHIPSYCPQGRGRMERFFGTWQGRLPREIQAAGIQTLEAANEYIRKKFLPWHNRTLAVKPKEEESAFIPAGGADLDGILCVQDDRIVGNDNTVHWGRKKLQILPQSWRSGLAKCRVRVCEHLDGNLSVRYGHRIVGWYDSEGKPLELQQTKAA